MTEPAVSTKSCPCGSGAPFSGCCEPVLEGRAKAERAEQMMRARYSAFATGAVDFLFTSHHSSTRRALKRRDLETWSRGSKWLGLEILGTEAGGPDDDKGTVSFRARYESAGKLTIHEERSEFAREEGEWRFVDGAPIPHEPVRREAPKVGRNEPCPCGSGKKYKKCCGA